jgi:competence protein ComEC
MTVHFIDVGQGDATLIECEGKAMLIDAGENDKGTLVQNYLQKNGISELEYAIGTHPHSDHIGGLDVIITKFDVKHVLLPDVETTTRTYDDVVQAMKYKRITPEHPKRGDTYELGSATFTILSSEDNEYNNLNDYSISILLENGNDRFIFTGDAETSAELNILHANMDISADVYHVGHHGSKTSSSESFVKAIKPKSAVISCGDGNEYGHPHAGPLNLFRSMGINVYRTDEDGTIIASSNGNGIEFSIPASTSWQVGEAKGNASDSDTDVESVAEAAVENEKKDIQGFVLNTNTLKIHTPNCSSVNKMSEKNKEITNLTKEELVGQGYEPCGICNP